MNYMTPRVHFSFLFAALLLSRTEFVAWGENGDSHSENQFQIGQPSEDEINQAASKESFSKLSDKLSDELLNFIKCPSPLSLKDGPNADVEIAEIGPIFKTWRTRIGMAGVDDEIFNEKFEKKFKDSILKYKQAIVGNDSSSDDLDKMTQALSELGKINSDAVGLCPKKNIKPAKSLKDFLVGCESIPDPENVDPNSKGAKLLGRWKDAWAAYSESFPKVYKDYEKEGRRTKLCSDVKSTQYEDEEKSKRLSTDLEKDKEEAKKDLENKKLEEVSKKISEKIEGVPGLKEDEKIKEMVGDGSSEKVQAFLKADPKNIEKINEVIKANIGEALPPVQEQSDSSQTSPPPKNVDTSAPKEPTPREEASLNLKDFGAELDAKLPKLGDEASIKVAVEIVEDARKKIEKGDQAYSEGSYLDGLKSFDESRQKISHVIKVGSKDMGAWMELVNKRCVDAAVAQAREFTKGAHSAADVQKKIEYIRNLEQTVDYIKSIDPKFQFSGKLWDSARILSDTI